MTSYTFRIKLRDIPANRVESVLQSISSLFNIEVTDVRKRGGV
jgi:hypothetical protein